MEDEINDTGAASDVDDAAAITSPPRKARATDNRDKLPSGDKDGGKPLRYSSGKKSKCLCGNPECDALMERMKQANPNRYAYFAVPKPPKILQGKPRPQQMKRREQRQHTYDRQVQALGATAKATVTDKNYSTNTKHIYASGHLPPQVYALFCNGKKRTVPNSIPRELGLRLSKEGICQYTDTDVYPHEESRPFIPLPNFAHAKLKAEVEMEEASVRRLEHAAISGKQTIPSTPAITRSAHAITTNPTAHAYQQADNSAMKLSAREQQLEDLRSTLIKQRMA